MAKIQNRRPWEKWEDDLLRAGQTVPGRPYGTQSGRRRKLGLPLMQTGRGPDWTPQEDNQVLRDVLPEGRTLIAAAARFCELQRQLRKKFEQDKKEQS